MRARVAPARRAVAALILAAAVSVGYLLLWPTALGGDTAYVTVHGVSMQPRFHTGDLAVVRRQSSYAVGDIVAYRSTDLHTTVMHRIVAVRGGRYTFKGDNNSFLDPDHPTSTQLIGRLVLRVPQWSRGVGIATGPLGLAMIAGLALGTGRTAQRTIRRKRGTLSRKPQPLNRARFGFLKDLPRPLAIAATISSSAVGLAVVLLVFAWNAPAGTGATAASTRTGQRDTFSYSATVRPSPAYDGTTAVSPGPVFRAVAKAVDVRIAYTGTPGTLAVSAQLSTASGWHSTLDLARPVAVERRTVRTVSLDLDALQARADAAARTIGAPAGSVTISLRALVVSGTQPTFTPSVKFVLTPLSFALAGDPSSLIVTGTAPGSSSTPGTRVVTMAGHTFAASSVRGAAIWLLVASALSFLVIVVLSRLVLTASEGVRIRRRYGPLMVPVEPMTFAPGRPVVTVTEIATLVRLAERYRLLVLHWERSGIETFVVQDENTTYCFRTGAGAAVTTEAEPVQHA